MPSTTIATAAEAPARRNALDVFRAGYTRMLEWLVSALMIVLFVEVTAGVVFRASEDGLIHGVSLRDKA